MVPQQMVVPVELVEFPFNEKLALLRLFESPEDETRLWDELAQSRPLIGLAGAGAGSDARPRYPNYETLFSLVRDHVLLRSEFTGNTGGDLEKLSTALRLGQCYMSLDILGNPKGFNAVMRARDGRTFAMGSEVPYTEGLTFEVTLPQKPKVPFDTVIIRNGERMMTSNSQVTQVFRQRSGVYRVMVRVIPTLPLPDGKKWIPWNLHEHVLREAAVRQIIQIVVRQAHDQAGQGRQLTRQTLILLKPAGVGGFLFQLVPGREGLSAPFDKNPAGRAAPHAAAGVRNLEACL